MSSDITLYFENISASRQLHQQPGCSSAIRQSKPISWPRK
jgi:hypothetical protein